MLISCFVATKRDGSYGPVEVSDRAARKLLKSLSGGGKITRDTLVRAQRQGHLVRIETNSIFPVRWFEPRYPKEVS